MTLLKRTGLSLLLACGALAGCSKSDTTAAAAASQGDEVTPAESSTTALTDGQKLQVLTTVDNGEIAQAELALSKATTPQVRDFANSMIEQHTRAKQQGAEFASQSGATPAGSALSDKLTSASKATLQKLQGTEASSFDHAYMKAQIKQHQEVLDLLDQQLIPTAGSTATRDQLTTARNMVQHHLTHAQEVEGTLGT